MATTLATPGVYVNFVPPSSLPIAGVGTSTAGFVGVSSHPDVKDKGPVLVTSWGQFREKFGDLDEPEKLPPPEGDPNPRPEPRPNPRALAAVDRVLAHAVYGFFNNGGTRCYVSAVENAGGVTKALEGFAAIDEIALVAAPLPVSGDATAQAAALGPVHDALLAHCTKLQDRFAILDSPRDIKGDQFARDNMARPQDSKDGYGAYYFPWLHVADPNHPDPATTDPNNPKMRFVAVPPSGHLAGVYARTDGQRGVFKAPANEVIGGVRGLRYALTDAQQEGLNPDGINCVRLFSGTPYVWGCRTLAPRSSEYEQVNVRRFLIFLRESLLEGTRFAVFEPNDPGLWQRITRSVGDFLYTQWRAGALFGETAKEAFFVKCDRDTNPDTAPKNQVVTEVGVAVVRAAEFVVFNVQQTRT